VLQLPAYLLHLARQGHLALAIVRAVTGHELLDQAVEGVGTQLLVRNDHGGDGSLRRNDGPGNPGITRVKPIIRARTLGGFLHHNNKSFINVLLTVTDTGKCRVGGKTVKLIVLSWLAVAHAGHAFEGDYVWDDRFRAGLVKAASGDREDQYALGDMYLKGRGTQRNPDKALEWFLKAARQGHVKAAYKSGHLIRRGYGTGQSAGEGLKWLRQAAEGGYAPAQYELGEFYAADKHGGDSALALIWLGRARKSGYRPALAAYEKLIREVVRAQKTRGRPSP
jgi:hypothetical protein